VKPETGVDESLDFPESACYLKAMIPFRKPLLITLALTVFQGTAPAEEGRGVAKQPNVLLILADDLGFSDLGCYGGEIETPNLDAIAGDGLKFSQFYNTARCWPTRGSLMTGYYAQQIRRDDLPGIPSGNGPTSVRPDWAVLLPEMLKPRGYRSYHTGKWHIDGMPIAAGFDQSYYLKDQGRFFNPTRHFKNDQALPPVEKGTDYYATTALADHVIEVLSEHHDQYGEAPFFHYLAFAAPHFPLHALPEDIAHYDERYQVGWDAIRLERWKKMRKLGLLDDQAVSELSRVERDLGPPYHFPDALATLGAGEVNKPVAWDSLNDEQKQFQAKKMAIHAAMIHRMDIEIGRVFDQIKAMGEWDDTLIIFLSDNGASAEIMVRDDGHDSGLDPGSAGTYLCLGPGWSTTCNAPFRRHKTWTHEGGISTPMLMSWPAGIEASGEICRDPGHVIDVVPTLLELAGAAFPSEAPDSPGKSLVPLFDGGERIGHDAIWWFHDGHKALRMGDWKAVAPDGEPWELYDLSRDRDESTDLAVAQSKRLSAMVKVWDRHLSEFAELAARGLSADVLEQGRKAAGRRSKMAVAKKAAMPKRQQVLINGERLSVKGRHAFIMSPAETEETGAKPWVFYGPTLLRTPDKAESWMHERFLKAGVAVAGIDVGEAYGSPAAFPFFEALYAEMIKRGYSDTPVLLGRSRGGLWVSSWALEHPERVAGIAGIYPVYDFTTYPTAKRAAPAYGMSEKELLSRQEELNPIRRSKELADAKVPVFIIHGKDDKVVPLDKNSAQLEKVYQANGAGDLIEVIKIDDQGHNYWPRFFQCQELVDFVIERATNAGK